MDVSEALAQLREAEHQRDEAVTCRNKLLAELAYA